MQADPPSIGMAGRHTFNENGRSRSSWKRLIVVAPRRGPFAILLGRRWLPEEIIVVAAREFADRPGVSCAALASHPGLALDAGGPMLTDQAVIDLTAGDDEREVVEFALESGRTMRVRPGGLVIRHDRFADIDPFQRATAREVTSGNTIVVRNQTFVHEARMVLPVRILAQTRLEVYHAAVEAALPGIPGETRTAKARQKLHHYRGHDPSIGVLRREAHVNAVP